MTKERAKRTPISGLRNPLRVTGQDPNYHYRIVNDNGDRIEQLKEYGYELVTDKTIKVGDRRVAVPGAEGSPVKVAVGQGMDAYLMRIKKEDFREIEAAKEADRKEIEETMKKDAKANSDYGKLDIGR